MGMERKSGEAEAAGTKVRSQSQTIFLSTSRRPAGCKQAHLPPAWRFNRIGSCAANPLCLRALENNPLSLSPPASTARLAVHCLKGAETLL